MELILCLCEREIIRFPSYLVPKFHLGMPFDPTITLVGEGISPLLLPGGEIERG